MTQSDLTQQQTVSKLIDSVNAASLIAEVLLAVAVFGFIGYVASSLDSTLAGLGQMNFAPRAPSQATWHPDSSFYCSWLHNLNVNVPDALSEEFSVELLADSAPTATAHNATVALYNDVANLRPTTKDLTAVVAAYPCPAN